LIKLHPIAPHHLPFYIAKPGETDVLMIVTASSLPSLFLGSAISTFGSIRCRSEWPISRKNCSSKLAVLGLLALFTHIHLFWIAALLLALIDLPDFGTPLRSIAGSLEKIADSAQQPASQGAAERPEGARSAQPAAQTQWTPQKESVTPKRELPSHA
jgi:hypothetical protein